MRTGKRKLNVLRKKVASVKKVPKVASTTITKAIKQDRERNAEHKQISIAIGGNMKAANTIAGNYFPSGCELIEVGAQYYNRVGLAITPVKFHAYVEANVVANNPVNVPIMCRFALVQMKNNPLGTYTGFNQFFDEFSVSGVTVGSATTQGWMQQNILYKKNFKVLWDSKPFYLQNSIGPLTGGTQGRTSTYPNTRRWEVNISKKKLLKMQYSGAATTTGGIQWVTFTEATTDYPVIDIFSTLTFIDD